jgi:hypothetical protein
MKPLAIDLFCGLGGWTEGLLVEGYYVVGFDIEQHVYGEHRYPGQLVIQDVLTLHGKQFKDAALIVGSSPCQEFSYRAMPWKRAKALPPPYLGMELFNAQFRIQREACEAAGRPIPMVVENVRGAIPWVGRSRWNYGSYHLWGDVPALMPMTLGMSVMNEGVAHRSNGSTNFHQGKYDGVKNAGGSWFAVSNNKGPHSRGDGIKCGGDWFDNSEASVMRRHGETRQRARKPYKCCECGRSIAIGEHYWKLFAVGSDGPFTGKWCEHCNVAKDWLWKECGGSLLSGVGEDIHEHLEYYFDISPAA